jgi:hypothetical protein
MVEAVVEDGLNAADLASATSVFWERADGASVLLKIESVRIYEHSVLIGGADGTRVWLSAFSTCHSLHASSNGTNNSSSHRSSVVQPRTTPWTGWLIPDSDPVAPDYDANRLSLNWSATCAWSERVELAIVRIPISNRAPLGEFRNSAPLGGYAHAGTKPSSTGLEEYSAIGFLELHEQALVDLKRSERHRSLSSRELKYDQFTQDWASLADGSQNELSAEGQVAHWWSAISKASSTSHSESVHLLEAERNDASATWGGELDGEFDAPAVDITTLSTNQHTDGLAVRVHVRLTQRGRDLWSGWASGSAGSNAEDLLIHGVLQLSTGIPPAKLRFDTTSQDSCWFAWGSLKLALRGGPASDLNFWHHHSRALCSPHTKPLRGAEASKIRHGHDVDSVSAATQRARLFDLSLWTHGGTEVEAVCANGRKNCKRYYGEDTDGLATRRASLLRSAMSPASAGLFPGAYSTESLGRFADLGKVVPTADTRHPFALELRPTIEVQSLFYGTDAHLRFPFSEEAVPAEFDSDTDSAGSHRKTEHGQDAASLLYQQGLQQKAVVLYDIMAISWIEAERCVSVNTSHTRSKRAIVTAFQLSRDNNQAFCLDHWVHAGTITSIAGVVRAGNMRTPALFYGKKALIGIDETTVAWDSR